MNKNCKICESASYMHEIFNKTFRYNRKEIVLYNMTYIYCVKCHNYSFAYNKDNNIIFEYVYENIYTFAFIKSLKRIDLWKNDDELITSNVTENVNLTSEMAKKFLEKLKTYNIVD